MTYITYCMAVLASRQNKPIPVFTWWIRWAFLACSLYCNKKKSPSLAAYWIPYWPSLIGKDENPFEIFWIMQVSRISLALTVQNSFFQEMWIWKSCTYIFWKRRQVYIDYCRRIILPFYKAIFIIKNLRYCLVGYQSSHGAYDIISKKWRTIPCKSLQMFVLSLSHIVWLFIKFINNWTKNTSCIQEKTLIEVCLISIWKPPKHFSQDVQEFMSLFVMQVRYRQLCVTSWILKSMT